MKKLITILTLVLTSNAFASTEFKFSPQSNIEAQISSDELNRIEINGGDIMEVIGDEGKYSLYWSSDWRNLFIKPKIPAGETFELSLIFFGGIAQDLRFTVGDTTAKTISIDMGRGTGQLTASYNLQSEIASMMSAMFEGIKSKYYVTDSKRLLKNTSQFEVKQIKAYRYKDLSGAILEVKNSSKTSIILRENDFRELFKNTLAINLKAKVLAPKTRTTLFIVTQRGVYDK